MVETITQYRTVDGAVFNNAKKAYHHEAALIAINKLVGHFPNENKLSSNQYYQLTKADVRFRKAQFCEMLRVYYSINDESITDAINAYESHNIRGGLIGRILCDSESPYYKVWLLFESIDDNYRMFNQPYFVYNPPANSVEIPH